MLAQNWTSDIKVILATSPELDAAYKAQLDELGMPIHYGTITEIHHSNNKIHPVTVDNGAIVDISALLCTLPEEPSPLEQNLVEDAGLELNKYGHIAANDIQQTNVDCLSAGEVQGWTNAIESANVGGMAAFFTAHGWYGERKAD